jgi:hypothetical protein
MAMPEAAIASTVTAREAAILARASAVWGGDALCTLRGTTQHDGKQSPLAGRQCPICWTMQEVASLLLPGPPAAAPAPARIGNALVAIDAFVQLARSPSQPRGPPVV